MKVNGIDIRKYDAKQLTFEVQPPTIQISKEYPDKGVLPIETDTQIQLGSCEIVFYFKGENRNEIIRKTSMFLSNFGKSADLEIDGYMGKYKAYLTADSIEKTKVKTRYKLTIKCDGYFYDNLIKYVYTGRTEAEFVRQGTRTAPCNLTITATNTVNNYRISGLTEIDIIITKLLAGESVVIDGEKGLITKSGSNDFENVDLWEFPKLKAGKNIVSFSSTDCKVEISYYPMWL